MADDPTQGERFSAATLAGQKMDGQPAPPAPRLDPDATPDYFGGVPNWALSPRIRKFVDELPGVGAAAANALGQYIPVATPDTVTYPGSDYYEIAVREYTEQLHSDLPATRLRGYVQLNLGTDAERPQHRRPRADQLPRPAHPRPPRPAGARQVRQPAPPGQGRRPVPARGRDDQGRRRGPAGRRRRVPAEPRVAPPARRARALDQRRHAVPVDHAGRRAQPLPVGPEPGQRPRHVVRRAGQAGERRDARGHQRPGPGRDDPVLPQRPERPLPLPARRHLRPHAPERVRGRGVALLRRRRRGGRARRHRHRPGRRAAARHRGQDLRPRRREAPRPGPDVGRRPVGRPRRALVSARVHAQPGRRRQGQRQGAVGLPAVVLEGLRGHGERPRGQPALRRRGVPAEAEPRHAEPVGGAERVPRHDARQRHRVPLREGRAQGLPAARPQRLRRPPAEPAAVLRALRHASPRPAPAGGPSSRPTPARSPCCRRCRRWTATGRCAGRRTGATAACPTRAPSGRR